MTTSNLSTRHVVHSLKSKHKNKLTFSEKISDLMTYYFGTITFLTANVLVFLFWLAVNTGKFPFLKAFDPFPFGLLTTIVSLEAIILSIFVLISQNRASKLDELREEVDLQIDIITESEITKLLKMIKLLLEKNGIDVSDDKDLKDMLKPINEEKLEKALEKQV